MKIISLTSLILYATLLASTTSVAGPLDPECSGKKAAKSAAMKSTIGVGGRCSPADAAKDTVGLDGNKGKKDKDGLLSKDDSDNSKDKIKDKEDKDGFGLKKKAVKTVL